MIQSMTAFASRTGTHDGTTWVWEVRSVNARGLDLRLRLPEGFDALDPAIRKAISAAFKRGSVSLTLKVSTAVQDQALALNAAQLDRVLDALEAIQDRAVSKGVTLGQPTAADVLTQRGVADLAAQPQLTEATTAAVQDDLAGLVSALQEMRRSEGAALSTVIAGQLDQIAAAVDSATGLLGQRKEDAASALKAAMQSVLVDVPVDPDRLAQELAVLAVKTDVTEEIDRLRAHVAAARDLLANAQQDGTPIGRKLDFLCQEFNREANTLCAKSQYPPLTAIGLDLKTTIDQMREQVQNVE